MILLLLLPTVPYRIRAAEPMTVYGGAVSGTYEDTLHVPVQLKNNEGLMGASIELSYDATVFTPIGVTQGEICSTGLFDYNLETTAETLRVVWSASEGCYADGVMFTVDFTVKGEAYGSYCMDIRCNSADTFNENYERLNLACNAATVTLTKEDAKPLLYSGSYRAAMGEAVDVFLRIADNSGLPAGTVTLSYDAAVLHFVEAQGMLAELNAAQSDDGEVRINIDSVAEDCGDGPLLRLRFRVKYCEAKNYTLQWSYTGNVSCHPVQLCVESGNARIYGSAIQKAENGITVPVCIAGNPGLMGMKLKIVYNASLLQLASVSRGNLMSDGMFSYNANEEGSLLIVWSGTEDIKADGELFVLQFSTSAALEAETEICVSYSQADTFNSAWQDVVLLCERIIVGTETELSPDDGNEEPPKEDDDPQLPPDGGNEEPPKEDDEPQLPPDDGNEEPPKEDDEPQLPPDDGNEEPPKEDDDPQLPPDGGKEDPPKGDDDPQLPPDDSEETKPEHDDDLPGAPCDGGKNCPGRDLTDMPSADHWAHAGIDFVLKRGLMLGVSDTKFAPRGEFTRAMMVMVLYRMENCPKSDNANTFKDVGKTAWYADAVTWATAKGVVNGYGNGYFKPNEPITREQIATMFCRYAKLKQSYEEAESDCLGEFRDTKSVSSWARTELNWAVGSGLIAGVGTGEGVFLQPRAHASREQLATILLRFLSNEF